MLVEFTTKFEWHEIGQVMLDAQGKLKFPRAPAHPGLYRFELAGEEGMQVYIGETDTLNRRFQHYRTPGPTQPTNILLNGLMRRTIEAGGSVNVAVVADGIVLNGGEHAVQLGLKSDRVLLEHAAVFAARTGGARLVNAAANRAAIKSR